MLLVLTASTILSGCRPPTEGDATSSASPEAEEKKSEALLPLVEVTTPRRGEIRDVLTLNGDLVSEGSIDLTTRVIGIVKAVHFAEGAPVTKGTIILELDEEELALQERQDALSYQDAQERTRSSQLALSEAEHSESLQNVSFQRAEDEFERFSKLAETAAGRAFTKEEFEAKKFAYDEAKLQLESAKLAKQRAGVEFELAKVAEQKAKVTLERAQLDLERCKVRSPIDGAISFLEVRVGELVQQNTLVATVVNRKRLYSEVRVPQRKLGSLEIGQPVEVRCEVDPGHVFPGRLEMIHPTVDPAEGTVKVRIGLDDKRGLLRPGMYVSASIVTASFDRALLVPKRARLFDRDQSVVFVVRDGKAKRVVLQTGLQTVTEVQVLEAPAISETSLRLDDALVIRGQTSLEDGQKVLVAGEEGKPTENATRDASEEATTPDSKLSAESAAATPEKSG